MSNIGDTKKALSGLVPNSAGAPMPTVNQLFDLSIQYNKTAADGSAAATTADLCFWSNPYNFPLYVVGGTIVFTGAGLTVDNSNYATIAIKTNNGVGGATATALSISTTITESLSNFVANVNANFTVLTPANAAINPGGGLWFNIAKTGSGVVVPVGYYVIRLQKGE